MNPGIYYLYEYKNRQRSRNVGFIKVSRRYQSCLFQIQARGIPVEKGAELELWAFLKGKDKFSSSQIAVLAGSAHSISSRLCVTENLFPEGHSLTEIDGFLIRNPGGISEILWAASSAPLPFIPDIIIVPEKEKIMTSAPERSASTSVPQKQGPENLPEKHISETAPEEPESENSPEEQITETCPKEPEMLPKEENPAEISASAQSEAEVKQTQDLPFIKKIRRPDIGSLPRKFWPLANNSFLLHGCRCYKHLILLEDQNLIWLGIPGIYDPQEAQAANLFGFSEFRHPNLDVLDLNEDEMNSSQDFGYWCRCLGTKAQILPFIS